MNLQTANSLFKFRFDVANLAYLEGYGNYTTLHLANGQKMLSCRNLKQFEEVLLSYPNFVRIHKSFVVNRAFVRGFQTEGNTQFVVLLCGRKLPVARLRKLNREQLEFHPEPVAENVCLAYPNT